MTGTNRMNRTLSKRLEKLETCITPVRQQIIHRISFISSKDKSVTSVMEVKNWVSPPRAGRHRRWPNPYRYHDLN